MRQRRTSPPEGKYPREACFIRLWRAATFWTLEHQSIDVLVRTLEISPFPSRSYNQKIVRCEEQRSPQLLALLLWSCSGVPGDAWINGS
jgi:hypothetical protein